MGSHFIRVEWWGDAVEGGLLLLRYVEDGRIAVSLNVESPDTYLSGSHDITSHEFRDKPARAVSTARAQNGVRHRLKIGKENVYMLKIEGILGDENP